jgi:prophage antirepressor-like protein
MVEKIMPNDRPVKVQLFETAHIRSHWDAELGEWFFSLVDVVAALTESVNPTDYLKKLRKRDEQLRDYIGTNCPQVAMPTETGKARKTLAATTQQLLRIVQSIPSKKAEPFKLWLAEVGSQRLDQLQDPELSIEQAMRCCRRPKTDHLNVGVPTQN